MNDQPFFQDLSPIDAIILENILEKAILHIEENEFVKNYPLRLTRMFEQIHDVVEANAFAARNNR
jgi:hypothetical protein